MSTWDKDWTNLHATLDLVRKEVTGARSILLTTSDQNMYGFGLADIGMQPGEGFVLSDEDPAEGAEIADRIGDEGWLLDIDWDGVVGEDARGNAEVSLETQRFYAVVTIGDVDSHPGTYLELLHDQERAARLAYYDAAKTAPRARLLQLDVPASWKPNHVASHAHGVARRDGNGAGVTVLADSRPLNLLTEVQAFDGKTAGLDSPLRQAVTYVRNTLAQQPTFGSLPTLWEVVNIDADFTGDKAQLDLDLSDGTTITLQISRRAR